MAAAAGGVQLRRRPRAGPAHGHQAAGDHPAGRAGLHGRRGTRCVAEVEVRRRLQRPRGADAAPPPLHRRRPRPVDPVPGVAHGDGGPLRRPVADAGPQERLRRGRVRHGDVRQQPAARVRLPRPHRATSTPTCATAAAGRSRSRTPSACTRRITASSGSTPTAACRTPPRSAAPAGWWCRASARWRTTSTASSGICTRTATSSSRSSSPASCRSGPSREGERPKYGTLIAPRLYAPAHQHFFNVRLDFDLDGVNNTVQQVDVTAEPLDAAQPLRERLRRPGHAVEVGGGRLRRAEPGDRPHLEGRQPGGDERAGGAGRATSSSPGTTASPSPRRTPGGGGGPGSSTTTSG